MKVLTLIDREEKRQEERKEILNNEIMTAEQQEKIIEYKYVAQWFLLAFNKTAISDYSYFCQWCNRYDNSIDWFVCNMDSQRRAAWLEYLQTGMHNNDESEIRYCVLTKNATLAALNRLNY